VLEAQVHMSLHPLRTTRDTAELLGRLAETAASRAIVRAYWSTVSMRSRRFVLTSRHKSAYARVVNDFTQAQRHGKRVVLCVGAAYWPTTSSAGTKHASNVPAILRTLSRFIRIVLVDEFRTTLKCACCCSGEMTIHPETRLGVCSNVACENRACDRDHNAARCVLRACAIFHARCHAVCVRPRSNMLRIVASQLAFGTRAEHLQRPGAPAGAEGMRIAFAV
jgi:hypothetical protein